MKQLLESNPLESSLRSGAEKLREKQDWTAPALKSISGRDTEKSFSIIESTTIGGQYGTS